MSDKGYFLPRNEEWPVILVGLGDFDDLSTKDIFQLTCWFRIILENNNEIIKKGKGRVQVNKTMERDKKTSIGHG
ncbi:hypothetical protein V1478_016096 [Vespula squamosa]|uniref:Uncharacterized protein n=1 Tax=Vespula squamosa TaxID=30214 RepID=A0ABD1ZYT9_VESSQ